MELSAKVLLLLHFGADPCLKERVAEAVPESFSTSLKIDFLW